MHPVCALFLAGALLFGTIVPSNVSSQPSEARTTEVYAVHYGTLPGFRVASLVANADTSRRMDGALMMWLIRRPDGRNVLVDAGFYREKFLTRWKPTEYRKPSDAIASIGLEAKDITDIIVTHVHWDHVDGVDLFPNARVWLQQAEFDHHVDSAGNVRDRAIDALNAAMLGQLRLAGRLELVRGDSIEVLPGIVVYTGGRHTFASQFVSVNAGGSVVVLASDNAYLYESLATLTPIAQTLDAESNRLAQRRMLRLAGEHGVVVPGHDPAVMSRFPKAGDGVVRIR